MNNKKTKAEIINQCEELYDAIEGPEGIRLAGYTTLKEDAQKEDWELLKVTVSLLDGHAEQLKEIANAIQEQLDEREEG